MQSLEQTDFFDLRFGAVLCDLLTFDWLLLASTAVEDWSYGLQGSNASGDCTARRHHMGGFKSYCVFLERFLRFLELVEADFR